MLCAPSASHAANFAIKCGCTDEPPGCNAGWPHQKTHLVEKLAVAGCSSNKLMWQTRTATVQEFPQSLLEDSAKPSLRVNSRTVLILSSSSGLLPSDWLHCIESLLLEVVLLLRWLMGRIT